MEINKFSNLRAESRPIYDMENQNTLPKACLFGQLLKKWN